MELINEEKNIINNVIVNNEFDKKFELEFNENDYVILKLDEDWVNDLGKGQIVLEEFLNGLMECYSINTDNEKFQNVDENDLTNISFDERLNKLIQEVLTTIEDISALYNNFSNLQNKESINATNIKSNCENLEILNNENINANEKKDNITCREA